MTGFSRDEVVGKTAVELGHLDRRAARRDRWRALQPGRSRRARGPASDQGRAVAHAGARQRPHRLRRRALPGHRRDRRDRAARDRGGAATERGAGARARRRAGGADGRGARRGLDLAGSRLPRDARQPNRARAAAQRRTGRTCRRRPPTRPPPALQGVRERSGGRRRAAAAAARRARRRGAKLRRGDPLRRRAGRFTCTAAPCRCAIRAARRAARSAPSST